jgi:hypothetical protein
VQIKEIMTGEPVVVGPEEQRQEWTLSDRLQDFIDMKDDAEISRVAPMLSTSAVR